MSIDTSFTKIQCIKLLKVVGWINKENIIVTTIKKAEDTDELVIWMFDTEGKNSMVDLKSYFKIKNFQHTNIIEENPVPVKELKVSKFGIETFTFKTKL